MAYTPPVNIPSLGGRNYAGELYGMFSGVGDAFYQNRRDKVGDAQWQSEQDRMNTAQALAQSNADRNYALELKKLEEPAGPPGYAGTSMDAQNWNIINSGDVNDPRYAGAYNQLFEQPKLTGVQTESGYQFIPQMPVRPAYVQPPPSRGAGVVPQPGGTGEQIQQTQAPWAQGGAGAAGDMGLGGVGAPVLVPGTVQKPTEQQVRDQKLYDVMAPEFEIVKQNFTALTDLGNQAGGMLPGKVNNFLTSREYQRATNALQTIIKSYLYSVSGATATEGEVATQARILTPVPGEDPASVADKLRRIEIMVDAVRNGGQTGGGQPRGQQAPAGATLTAPGAGVTFQKVSP